MKYFNNRRMSYLLLLCVNVLRIHLNFYVGIDYIIYNHIGN